MSNGRRRLSLIAIVAVAGSLCAGCSPTPPTYPTIAAKCGSSAAPPTKYDHIVVVVEENRTWNSVGGVGFADPNMPFFKDAGKNCTVFADWYETNTTQNSLNQYIGLTSGVSNNSTVDDCDPSPSCQSVDDNIFRQIRRAGGTARTYVDGATTACSDGSPANAAKHIPALYYYGTYTDTKGTHNDHDFCSLEVRPLSQLNPNGLPTFAMIIPNLCNDGHDCLNATVDAWAAAHLLPLLNGSTYSTGKTAVMVMYDEDHPVPNLLIAPTAKRGVNLTPGAGHAAMLRTWEEMLGLPVMPVAPVTSAISLRAPSHI